MRKLAVIGAVLAVALVTAVVITIFSDCRYYVKEDACEGQVTPGLGPVLVTTRDIQAGESMDALVEDGGIVEMDVPLEALVDGAARDVSQIEGRKPTRQIEKDEQISTENLSPE